MYRPRAVLPLDIRGLYPEPPGRAGFAPDFGRPSEVTPAACTKALSGAELKSADRVARCWVAKSDVFPERGSGREDSLAADFAGHGHVASWSEGTVDPTPVRIRLSRSSSPAAMSRSAVCRAAMPMIAS